MDIPIDAVYTYVDGKNDAWKNHYSDIVGIPLSDIRFTDHGELLFSLQLLLMHCPWVRNVYIVHSGSCINTEMLTKIENIFINNRSNVIVIPQSDIMNGPSFNSCAVESMLWKLPNISEYFLYLNDDMGFGRPVPKSSFIHVDGIPWIDCSAALSMQFKPTNLAQIHNENARVLFNAKFKNHKLPRVNVAHLPALICRRACECMWDLFEKELSNIPLARDAKFTINTQLLSSLIAHIMGWGRLRTRCHRRPHYLSRAFVESQREGLNYIMETMPHLYCINGICEQTQGMFSKWTEEYIQKCKHTTVYPKILLWSWPSIEYIEKHKHNGDDRNSAPKAKLLRPWTKFF